MEGHRVYSFVTEKNASEGREKDEKRGKIDINDARTHACTHAYAGCACTLFPHRSLSFSFSLRAPDTYARSSSEKDGTRTGEPFLGNGGCL